MAAKNHLLLSWNDHSRTFLQFFSSVREKGLYTDVTVSCDGKFYEAHKLVLSTCSRYFEEMLQNTPCKHPIIVLTGIASQELDALLRYMYAGQVTVSQDKILALMKAAKALHIKGLDTVDDMSGNGDKGLQLSDRRYSPLPNRQRRERDVTPTREEQTSHAPHDNKVPNSSHNVPLPTSPPYEKEGTQDEEFSVKTEPPLLPSSPYFQTEEEGELESFRNGMDTGGKGPISLPTNATNRRSFSGSPNRESYKEEVLERASSGPPGEAWFTSPLSSASAGTVTNSTPLGVAGEGMDGHPRILPRGMFLPEESNSFHLLGPSSMPNNLGIHDRESYPSENYSNNKKSPEGYISLPGPSSASPVRIPPPTDPPSALPIGEEGRRGGGPFRPRLKRDSCYAKKVHRCSYCQYTTPWGSVFVRHLRKHTGEKPFHCPHCPFRSGWKSHLASHVRKSHAFV